jgi:hypothetical protein
MISFVVCRKAVSLFRISVPSLSVSLSCYLRPTFVLF